MQPYLKKVLSSPQAQTPLPRDDNREGPTGAPFSPNTSYPFDYDSTVDPSEDVNEFCTQTLGWVGGEDQVLPIPIIYIYNSFSKTLNKILKIKKIIYMHIYNFLVKY